MIEITKQDLKLLFVKISECREEIMQEAQDDGFQSDDFDTEEWDNMIIDRFMEKQKKTDKLVKHIE